MQVCDEPIHARYGPWEPPSAQETAPQCISAPALFSLQIPVTMGTSYDVCSLMYCIFCG